MKSAMLNHPPYPGFSYAIEARGSQLWLEICIQKELGAAASLSISFPWQKAVSFRGAVLDAVDKVLEFAEQEDSDAP